MIVRLPVRSLLSPSTRCRPPPVCKVVGSIQQLGWRAARAIATVALIPPVTTEEALAVVPVASHPAVARVVAALVVPVAVARAVADPVVRAVVAPAGVAQAAVVLVELVPVMALAAARVAVVPRAAALSVKAPRAVVGARAVPATATATTATPATAEETRADLDLAPAMVAPTMAEAMAAVAPAMVALTIAAGRTATAMAARALLLALEALQMAIRDLATMAVVAVRVEEAAEIADAETVLMINAFVRSHPHTRHELLTHARGHAAAGCFKRWAAGPSAAGPVFIACRYAPAGNSINDLRRSSITLR